MLAHFVETWTSLYANHAVLRTAVTFTHIAGLLSGGGCAITADLAVLTIGREPSADRRVHLGMLKRTHPLVVFGLAALTVSGLLLLAADADTYLHSRIFWTKMALIVVLVVNGAFVLSGERRAAQGDGSAWARLHYAAMTSLALWTLITLAGAALPNVG